MAEAIGRGSFGKPEGGQNSGELILYNTEDGRAQIQMHAVDGTVWLTQVQMAELFDVTPQNVGQHIRNIYSDGELIAGATRKDVFLVQPEADRLVRRQVLVYNLDVVLAVGYRVRSPRGSQFRQWASTILRGYLVTGFALDDERLKDPAGFDYFDELLERIRDIRASEKRFYQKVRDTFATSIDYDKTAQAAKDFFATIQNKLVYGVTLRTAAELIVERADPGKPNMGLTSWRGTVVRKGDVSIAKNYLSAEEIKLLNLLTTQFLDFAELRARRRQAMKMADWMTQTDRFLELNEMPILNGRGRVAHKDMEAIASAAYEHYAKGRRELEAIAAEEEADAELEAIAEAAFAQDIDRLEEIEEDLNGRSSSSET